MGFVGRTARFGVFLVALSATACSGGSGSSPAPPVSVGPPPIASASPSPLPSSTHLPTPTNTPSATPTATFAATSSVDCTATNTACPTIAIAGDAPSSGGFHGYADPSMRYDSANNVEELAYSWAHALADGTHVIDLHLAHSNDAGTSWTFDGALYASKPFANSSGGAYAANDDTSTETVNLLAIPEPGGTTWVQAHWAYLVAAGSKSTTAQNATTSYISVSAIALPAGSQPSALLGLNGAPEARLGNAGTDATLHPTIDIAALAAPYASCTTFQQPAMTYRNGTLYLALQCSGGGAPAAFAVFSTTPTGSNATTWTWKYNGEIATAAQASALAAREGLPYTLFTELDFALANNGTLLAVLSGALPAAGIQPYEQYGCRVVPVTSLDNPTLATDASGVLAVTAKVTASDLYTSPNEGPGACTYDANSHTGIVIVRKLENDPTLGFFPSLNAAGLAP